MSVTQNRFLPGPKKFYNDLFQLTHPKLELHEAKKRVAGGGCGQAKTVDMWLHWATLLDTAFSDFVWLKISILYVYDYDGLRQKDTVRGPSSNPPMTSPEGRLKRFAELSGDAVGGQAFPRKWQRPSLSVSLSLTLQFIS